MTKKTLIEMFEAAYKISYQYGRIGVYETDDLVQNAMLRLLSYDPIPANTVWLRKTIRSVASDLGRKEDKHIKYRDTDVETFCVNEWTHDSLDLLADVRTGQSEVEIDLMPQLKGVLAKLSKPHRTALILHVEGYSNEEIAQMTNTNISTVKTRIHYARKIARGLAREVA